LRALPPGRRALCGEEKCALFGEPDRRLELAKAGADLRQFQPLGALAELSRTGTRRVQRTRGPPVALFRTGAPAGRPARSSEVLKETTGGQESP
jgi:hypothetical protein